MRKYLIGIFVFMSVFTFSFYYFVSLNNNKIGHTIEHKYIADFRDKRKVSGFAQNIFIGKILKNNTESLLVKRDIEFTEYKVEVIDTIKGDLKGEIIVSQSIGYDELGYKKVPVGVKELEEGSIYVLAVGGPKNLMLTHENGHELLDDGKSKNKDILSKINERKEAYVNEVYYEGDLLISTYENAYKDLSEAEKQAVKNKEFSLK